MKRRPALLQLSREHHAALVLANRIAKAGDDAAIAALIESVPAFFRQELEPHFRQEETDLLPRLELAGEAALAQRTLAEHQALRALVTRLAAGDSASLKPFGVALHDHVRFEDRQLFVTAEAVLPTEFLDTPL